MQMPIPTEYNPELVICYLELRGLTRTEIARRIGTTSATVNRVIEGKRLNNPILEDRIRDAITKEIIAVREDGSKQWERLVVSGLLMEDAMEEFPQEVADCLIGTGPNSPRKKGLNWWRAITTESLMAIMGLALSEMGRRQQAPHR